MSRDETFDASSARVPAVLLGGVAALLALDVVSDLAAGTQTFHLLLEGAGMALALGGMIWLWRRARAAQREAGAATRDLQAARQDAQRWRQEAQAALAGLGQALDLQFARWEFTAAEKEIALLLLKGLSLKEIAQVRETSERTVRQQTLGIYRKSGVAGRSELAAFFLEDLLLPAPPAPPR